MISKLHYSNFDNTNFFFPVSSPEHIKLMYMLKMIMEIDRDKLILDDSEISVAYGSFPGSIWNGGRTISNKKESFSYIEDTINKLNNNGVVYRTTFTNCLLEEKHLDDEYCNRILDIMDNDFGNEIVITSSILERYIRKTHPNLQLISSITKGNTFEVFKENFEKDYYMVVGYAKKNVLDYIQKFPLNERKRVEILLNSGCAYCKMNQLHYKEVSYRNLGFNDKGDTHCYRLSSTFSYDNITEDEIIMDDLKYLRSIGIVNYKLQGRCESLSQIIEEVIRILFKYEYVDTIVDKCKNRMKI